MKRFLFLFFLVVIACGAHALILETVELTNGTILQGYTAGMDKKGQTIFLADRVTMKVDPVDVAEQIPNDDGSVTLTISDKKFRAKNNDISESDNIFMFSGIPISKRYEIDPSSIKKISREAVDKSQLSGLLDKVIKSSGESVIGIVTTQIPGNYWEITTTEGRKIRIKSSEVDALEKVRIDEYNFFNAQSPLIYTYTMLDGTKHTGVLKKKDWTTGSITIVTDEEVDDVINNSDIQEYKTNENRKYKPARDKKLNDNDVVLNETVYYKLENIEFKAQEIKIQIHDKNEINLDGKGLTIETNLVNDGLVLYKVATENIEKKGFLGLFKSDKIRIAEIPLKDLETQPHKKEAYKTSIISFDKLDCGYYLLMKETSETQSKRIIKKGIGVLFKVVGSDCNEENTYKDKNISIEKKMPDRITHASVDNALEERATNKAPQATAKQVPEEETILETDSEKKPTKATENASKSVEKNAETTEKTSELVGTTSAEEDPETENKTEATSLKHPTQTGVAPKSSRSRKASRKK